MNFLHPLWLAALPLAALPILIHLINQRRYQTIRWGAMMFLLAANRMSRGYARLRQWLIMAARIAAIAALVFVVGRPLASGWLGLAGGGRADTAIILWDGSPSMQQTGAGTAASKWETGRQQLVQALHLLGSSRWVLIDSARRQPHELGSPDDLLKSAAAQPTSASSDIPALLQAAHDYIRDNQTGRTEIWICSDLRENDWSTASGRWTSLCDAFLQFPQSVRFHLLAYPQQATGNVSVRVTQVARRRTARGAELLVSLRLTREGGTGSKVSVPVQFELDGARSVVNVDLVGSSGELKDHSIPLDNDRQRGWGRVSLSADENPADNDFYFTFDEPVPRRALIVTDEPQAARALQLVASIAPEPAVRCAAEVVGPEQLGTVEWETLALLLWQAPLPAAEAAKPLETFVRRGGHVLFLPPPEPGDGQFHGVGWSSWVAPARPVPIANWRGDQDLWTHTQSGQALPVGQLEVRRYCGLQGEVTPLATLQGDAVLLARVPTDRGGVYFCATTPAPGDSSLATAGVVLYVSIQRLLAAGAAVLGNTRQLVAGDTAGEDPATWQRVAGGEGALSTDFAWHRGVYAAGERWLSVNRAAEEDAAAVVPDQRLAELFRGLDYSRVDDQAGSGTSLVQEVWRLFLVAMLVALVAEAALCLPPRKTPGAAQLALRGGQMVTESRGAAA